MQFGCFVQLEGLRKRWEGLVHISQVDLLHITSNNWKTERFRRKLLHVLFLEPLLFFKKSMVSTQSVDVPKASPSRRSRMFHFQTQKVDGQKAVAITRVQRCVSFLQLRKEGRVNNVSDVVQRGQKVKVKCLSFTGQKTGLSLKVRSFKRICMHEAVLIKD